VQTTCDDDDDEILTWPAVEACSAHMGSLAFVVVMIVVEEGGAQPMCPQVLRWLYST
jgi:hypothetical protein